MKNRIHPLKEAEHLTQMINKLLKTISYGNKNWKKFFSKVNIIIIQSIFIVYEIVLHLIKQHLVD